MQIPQEQQSQRHSTCVHLGLQTNAPGSGTLVSQREPFNKCETIRIRTELTRIRGVVKFRLRPGPAKLHSPAPAQDVRAPGQARTEADEDQQAAPVNAPRFNGFVQGERDGGGGSVAVAI